MPRLIVSNQAQDDTAYLLRDLSATAGHAVAARYAAKLENFYKRLQNFPDSGAVRPVLSPLARIGVVRPYLVIYEVETGSEGPITILRIVHGRRKITGRLLLGGDL